MRSLLLASLAIASCGAGRMRPAAAAHTVPGAPETAAAEVETIHPVYAGAKFFVAPRYHGVYPTLSPWAQPLAREDSSFGERDHLWDKDLPSRAMQRMGLPEGGLADGGEISGFVYFENATRHESRLTFRADIDDGQSGDQLAEIAIPFRVQ